MWLLICTTERIYVSDQFLAFHSNLEDKATGIQILKDLWWEL